jgi:hypothetical protein
MSWDKAIELVTPHVVKIATPSGHGTGFLSLYNAGGTMCGIATAAHVVAHADEWQEPIRVSHDGSDAPIFLTPQDRVIYCDYANDSAMILFLKGDLKLPEIPIALFPPGAACPIGASIGWLGYPAIAPDTLCFFTGIVSAQQNTRRSYFIDGVAINGVSGGPVFHGSSPNIQIIGSVSAYHANRATGEALPGLLRAQDVSHFHAVARYIASIDEARAQKQAVEEAQKQAAAGATAGTAPVVVRTRTPRKVNLGKMPDDPPAG